MKKKITLNNRLYNVEEANKAGDSVFIQDSNEKLVVGDEVYIMRVFVDDPDNDLKTRLYGKGTVVGSRAFAKPQDLPHSGNTDIYPNLDLLGEKVFDPNGGMTNFAEIRIDKKNEFEGDVMARDGEFDMSNHASRQVLVEISEAEAEWFDEILNRTPEENARETARAFRGMYKF